MIIVYNEHEPDWPLYCLHAFRQMLPYAAGHVNYAHLQYMEVLPTDIHKDFMKGEYTMCPFPGTLDG